MPIYEYKCEECGKEFEMFRSITEDDSPGCKFCNGPVKKLISRSSFHLKGTGWYVTDYAGKKPNGSSDEKKEASTETSSCGTTEKKEDSSPKKSEASSSD